MKHWKVSESKEFDFHDSGQILVRLLEGRGITGEEKQEQFLQPRLSDLSDPLRIPDMEKAVIRVEEALRSGQRILIYSDYDVDGMTSGALMFRFLTQMGKHVKVFIPERISEGYGLSIAGLERAFTKGKPDLLLALDCGTTSREEVAYLKEKGVDVVIIDHHELPPELPDAYAIVNPQRGMHDHILATVGLVFKFCHAFLKLRNAPDLFDLKAHLDFVAMGTVADIVPLLEDNRILVYHGLKRLSNTTHIGIQELMQIAGVHYRPTPVTIGFALGPRLNASGRMAEAQLGWELLITQDRMRAATLARKLDLLNRRRQEEEQLALQEAEEMLDKNPKLSAKCVVVASKNWHQGIVGIVASRLQRTHYCPTIVISIDEQGRGKGSGRSIEGCSIMDGLRHCQSSLLGFGGHAMAAGLEIEMDKISVLRHDLQAWLSDTYPDSVYERQIHVDFELPGTALTKNLAEDMMKMEPFGRLNPEPVFAVREVSILSHPRVFGKNHVRFRATANHTTFDVVGFNVADTLLEYSRFDLAGNWSIDSFSQKPCFRIIDYHPNPS